MSAQRIAVIGGVASGPAAAAEAVRVDPDAEVVLFEQGPTISYGACEMPYYVAGWIKEAEQLVILSPDEFERTRGAAVKTRHKVLILEPRRDRITVENLATGSIQVERFDKIILAVGASARRPDIDGLDAPNVFPMRRLDDAVGVRTYLDTHAVKHAVIFGGGYIGLEVAEALRSRNVRVTVLEPTGRVLNVYLDDELRPLVEDLMRAHGVVVRKEMATGLDHAPDGTVRAVLTDRGERIGCQLVILAMGITPNTDLAEAAGVKIGETGALAVDDGMRTNVPGVWACGDCVEVTRVIDEAKVYLPLSPVAFRTAHVAARNAARRGRGPTARFPGVCMASAIKLFDMEIATVGLKLQEARAAGFDAVATTVEHWSRVRIYPGSKPLHVRFITECRSGRLLGAELIGQEGAILRADVLVPCIREGWTVEAIRDLDLIYTPPLAPAHDPLLVAAHKAYKHTRRS